MAIDELDWFVPHQANLRIIEAVAKRLKFPMEKVLVNIDRYGNTSAATIPTMLDEAIETDELKRTDSFVERLWRRTDLRFCPYSLVND